MTVKEMINYLLLELYRAELDPEICRASNWEDDLLVIVNGTIVKVNYNFQEGDKVVITPMFSGG